MILQRPKIIVGDARYEPQKSGALQMSKCVNGFNYVKVLKFSTPWLSELGERKSLLAVFNQKENK